MNRISSLFWKINWFVKNYRNLGPEKLLLENKFLGPVIFNSDSVATSNNCDFLRDPRFARAYAHAVKSNPWTGFEMQWRTFIVCSLAEMVKKLPGNFVECGVNTGAYSRAIIDYIDFNATGKTFFLFDTYEGLVSSQITEKEKGHGIGKYLDTYKPVYDQVVEAFAPFNTRVVKGIVPESLAAYDGAPVCYLSIDMNVVAPEIAAAEFFWDKLVPGGVMVLDDYGFPAHIEQKKAFDVFAAQKGVSIIYIPTGQALIFKH